MNTRLVRGEGKFNDASVIHTLLGDARIGLWVIEIEDGKEPRMFADETMLDLLGVTDELTPEECYTFWYSRVDEAEKPRVQEAVARINAMEFAEVHYAYHHPAWGTIYVRCGGTRNPDEKRFASLNGFHQDITELQEISKTSETLRTDNEDLLFSLNNLFNSLYRIDPVRKVIYTMRAPEDMVLPAQMDYDDFLERSVASVHPDDRESLREAFCKEHLQELWLSGVPQFAREYRRRYNNGYRWMAFQVYFLDMDGKRKWGIFGTRDVNERRSQEELNRQALADACEAAEASIRAKVEFLSRMSHDVRTPINAILGMATLAKAKQDRPEEVMSCIDRIEDAGQLLYRLVNEILDISRADSNEIRLEKEPLSIHTIVQDSIQMVITGAQERSVTLETAENVRHDAVLGDSTRLREILMNFLTNAIKYTPAGGRVTLTVTELLATTGNNIGYQFECKDTGIGISEEFLPKVFEPFEREEDSRVTKVPGTGLGLTITQNLVHLMNGWVNVTSKKGEGSTFTAVVYLEPQADTAPSATSAAANAGAADQAAEESGEIRLDGVHILIAEDNEINREIAVELLEMAGAAVRGVENGQEAVTAYAEEGHTYDVILMDIKMPVMDGNEASRRIREIEAATGRHIPIIALTANSFAEDIAESRASGIDAHLTKPYNQQDLFRTIQEFIQA